MNTRHRNRHGTAACTVAREAEVRALTAPAIRDLIEELGLRLVRFGSHRI